MSHQKHKRILGMTYLQIGILAGGGIFAFAMIGCFFIILLYENQVATIPATKIPLSTPTSIPVTFVDRYGTPPNHSVGDYWDNGKGNNFAYFLVVDKSISLDEAETLITYYKQKHPGFKLINIYIFCDDLYSDFKFWDAMDYSGGLGDEIFKHIMFWYQTGQWSSSGVIFMTEPNVDYPTFGLACE